MEIAIGNGKSLSWLSPDRLTHKMLDEIFSQHDEFRRIERKGFLERKPTAEQLAEHKKTLTSLLKWFSFLEMLTLDADFPARDLVPEIEGRRLLLQESMKLIHNPMSDEEADKILAKF